MTSDNVCSANNEERRQYLITDLMVDIVESDCVKGGDVNMDCENCDFSPKEGYRKGCCNFGTVDAIKILRSIPIFPPQNPALLACYFDLQAYEKKEILFEDIRACSGKSCNYCGRWPS